MSFLAGRLAATEGAFFSHNSKQALSRLRDKLNAHTSIPSSPSPSSSADSQADVLPEILRHSLPPQHYAPQEPAQTSPGSSLPQPSSLAASLTAVNPTRQQKAGVSQSIIADREGPLAFLASVPQTSFGPRRWKPESEEVPILASTANEARTEHADSARLKDVMEGYFTVFKAFAIATSFVVGGLTIIATVAGSKLQINSLDEIRSKGHDYMQPRAEAIQQQFEPWRQWAHQRSRAWHMDESQHKVIGAEFAKSLGVKQRHGQFKESER